MSYIDNMRAQRDRLRSEAKAIVEKAAKENRDLSAAEKVEFDAIDETLEGIDARIEELIDHETRNAQLDAIAKQLQPEPTPPGQRQIRVGQEPRTYTPESRHSFFGDLIAAERGDYEARERIDRHRQETRDIGTGALGALVPPAYLPELYAKNLRAGRVTANLATRLPLPPEGMTVNVPRGTTGTVVASQSGENTSVTEVDFDETTLTVDVRTLAGAQDISRQALDRGHLVDQVLFADLVADYNRQLDSQVINGSASNGQHRGILNTSSILSVTFSTTSAVGAFYGAIANAAQQVASSRYLAPDVVVMHPRRWGWLTSKVDADGRPIAALDGPGTNAMASGSAPGEGPVGTLMGLPVYLDANVPTTISSSTFSGSTEDVVIVGVASDWLLWEENGGSPLQFRYDDGGAGTLTSKLVVMGYSGFTAGWHPSGTCVISGSFLTAPTF